MIGKKYTSLLFFLVAVIQLITAQKGSIEGIISDEKGPLEFVSISLFHFNDSTKVDANIISDDLGKYKFDKISFDKYKISFELIGYKTMSKVIVVDDHSEKTMDIVMIENSNLLNGVTVSAQKNALEKTVTGFIINAAANITQAGGTAIDILKSTPTINVDAEGAVTLRGKAPMLLINGRNTTIKNLNQIAASNIESIEIINNANAKYDANAESGIINIRLKKNKQDGNNGNFTLGIGRGAKGRISSSTLLNHKTNQWNIGIGYDNRFAGRIRAIDAYRITFDQPDFYNLKQERHDNRMERLQNLAFNIDFIPDTTNSFSLEITGNKEGEDNLENLNSLTKKIDQTFSSRANRFSSEYENSKVAEMDMTYNRKFKDKNKTLSVVVSSAFNDDKENTNIDSKDFSENQETLRSYSERTHNYEDENLSILQIDYACPSLYNGIIEIGYKGISRYINSDYETADEIAGSFIVNKSASNIFNFKELVNAGYIEYSSNTREATNSKWNVTIGLRAEQTNNSGSTLGNEVKFNNSYLKFFPSTRIAYNFSSNSFLKLNYSKRINRPEVDQFNPFVDITDALNPHSGNPNLKPEIAQNFELGYAKEWAQMSFSTNLFYRYANDAIRQFQTLKDNGVVLRMPVNIGSTTTYGCENIFSGKVSTVCNFNGSVSIFETKLNGSNLDEEFVNNAVSFSGKLINNIIPFENGKIQIIGSYIAPIATAQGRNIAQKFIDLGYQQKISKNGNARIGITIIDLFNTLKSGYQNFTPQFQNQRYSKGDTRAIMLAFGYTFRSSFKDKLLDNKFSKE
jgi:hypothetical protein